MSDKDEYPTYVTLTSGFVAALGSTFIKHPLDRLKWIRQVSSAHSAVTQTSYVRMIVSIVQTESFGGLWMGVGMGITRNLPHAILMYTAYPKVRHGLSKQFPNHRKAVNSLSGSIASTIVTLVTHPIDTMRVRYAVQYLEMNYTSYHQTLSTMRKEGMHSFYRGLWISSIGTVIRGGVGFGLYESLKSEDMRQWSARYSVFQRLSIGWIAGTCSTFIAYPAATIKRRMQVWGTTRNVTAMDLKSFGDINPNNYRNARTLFLHILRTENIYGFYKGLPITMFKTPLATSISLTLNDWTKKFIFDIDA
eukprot:17162_1